eukprot:TRINITY_DN29930_c0_g1_i1.p1 TRINITY_DN29930_c0_g1~~TRINITY_DN29930_c0_g1_i1.p1  ORF type:complete len:829 (-),score=180.16 TRINITY_DN29930_c0_g1_i1:70-2556(-)
MFYVCSPFIICILFTSYQCDGKRVFADTAKRELRLDLHDPDSSYAAARADKKDAQPHVPQQQQQRTLSLAATSSLARKALSEEGPVATSIAQVSLLSTAATAEAAAVGAAQKGDSQVEEVSRTALLERRMYDFVAGLATNATKHGSPAQLLEADLSAMQMLTVVYVFLVSCCVLQACANADARTVAKMQEASAEREKLKHEVDDLVHDMSDILKNILESSTLLAHHKFEDNRKDFLRCMKRLADTEEFDNDDLREPFKSFVGHWLLAFEECCMDPLNTPNRAFHGNEIEKCGSCPEIARVVHRRVTKMTLSLDIKELQALCRRHKAQAQLDDTSSSDDEDESVYGPPATLVSAVLFGLALAGLSYYTEDVNCCVIAMLTMACSWYLCYAIPSVSPLEELRVECERLQDDIEDAQGRAEQVHELHMQFERLSVVWLHRTVPWLEILHEVQAGLLDCPPSLREDFLQRSCNLLAHVRKALGPLQLWCGPDALDQVKLMVVASQLEGTQAEELPQMAVTRTMRMRLDSWIPNDAVSNCTACQSRFGIFNHRHHCRKCGKIFCEPCSSRSIPIPEKGYLEPVRVCDACSGWANERSASACSGCRKSFRSLRRKAVHCRNCGQLFCNACRSKEVAIKKLGYYDPVPVCDACAKKLQQERQAAKLEREKNLRVPEMLRRVMPRGFLTVKVVRGLGLSAQKPLKCFPDCYVRLRVEQREWIRTRTIADDADPSWNEEFFFGVLPTDRLLSFEIFDSDGGGAADDFAGRADVKFTSFATGEFHTLRETLRHNRSGGTLELEVQLVQDMEELVSMWSSSLEAVKSPRKQTFFEELIA